MSDSDNAAPKTPVMTELELGSNALNIFGFLILLSLIFCRFLCFLSEVLFSAPSNDKAYGLNFSGVNFFHFEEGC